SGHARTGSCNRARPRRLKGSRRQNADPVPSVLRKPTPRALQQSHRKIQIPGIPAPIPQQSACVRSLCQEARRRHAGAAATWQGRAAPAILPDRGILDEDWIRGVRARLPAARPAAFGGRLTAAYVEYATIGETVATQC